MLTTDKADDANVQYGEFVDSECSKERKIFRI